MSKANVSNPIGVSIQYETLHELERGETIIYYVYAVYVYTSGSCHAYKHTLAPSNPIAMRGTKREIHNII